MHKIRNCIIYIYVLTNNRAERNPFSDTNSKNIVNFPECLGKSSGRRHPHKGPSIKRGLSAKLTGEVFFSPLIAVGDRPPLFVEGGLSAAAGFS